MGTASLAVPLAMQQLLFFQLLPLRLEPRADASVLHLFLLLHGAPLKSKNSPIAQFLDLWGWMTWLCRPDQAHEPASIRCISILPPASLQTNTRNYLSAASPHSTSAPPCSAYQVGHGFLLGFLYLDKISRPLLPLLHPGVPGQVDLLPGLLPVSGPDLVFNGLPHLPTPRRWLV